MSMTQKIEIDGKEVLFRTSAAITRIYRWGLNTQTDIESKKNFAQLTAK